MSYYPDLAQTTMVAAGSYIRAIGWLSVDIEFPIGKVSPAMVHHYVTQHDYRPEAFIEAVLNCPIPKTDEYSEAISPFRALQKEYRIQVAKNRMEDVKSLCRRR